MFTELIADVKIKPLWSRICNYNQELKEHSKHVCDLTYAVWRELDYSESAIKDIVMGALLHDIGKIYIEHDVLEKRGPLTGDEYEQIMKIADVIVLTLNQKLKSINNFAKLREKEQFYNSRKVIPILDKYDKFSKYNNKNVSRCLKEKKIRN